VTGDRLAADSLLARLDALTDRGPDLQLEVANAYAFRAMLDDDLEEALRRFYEAARFTRSAPDRAYTVWVNLSCIAAALGRPEEALACAESADVLDLPPLVTPLHAIRASLLVRMGRVDAARAALGSERVAAQRSGIPRLLALADHDEGQFALAAGEYERAAELLARALNEDAAVSRPAARLARAEALARGGRPGDAQHELRQVTLEPLGPADRPHTLVAGLTHVEGLIARARGDDRLAARRLREAAAAWRRTPNGSANGEAILANLVDLGRPAVATIEPAREVRRIEAELHDLEALTHTTGEPDAHV
jgi:tetratricopeptide (TPR) repeat protein